MSEIQPSLPGDLSEFLKRRLRPAWRRFRSKARLLKYCWYDYRKFLLHSGAINKVDLGGQAAQIIKYYHMIEKGLALPEPRPGFGHHAIEGLCELVRRRLEAGDNASHLSEAIEVLKAYSEFNLPHDGQTPVAVTALLAQARELGVGGPAGAVRAVTRQDIADAVNFDTHRFFSNRYSVRQFSSVPVPRAKIEAAARIAQTAPSVCNRQAGRIHIVTDETVRNQWLKFQNGNRGFGETIGALAVITVDLRAFVESEERYQGWIDGGLFAMNFIMGLHAQELGSCCLNWSSPSDNDAAFHRFSGISTTESVIMFLAIGELRDDFVVARSPRKPLSEILTFVGG